MDVKALGQGGQNAFEFNYGKSSSNSEINSNTEGLPIQIDNNVNSDNLEHTRNGSNGYEKNSVPQRAITERDIKNAADKLNKLLEGKDTHIEYEPIGKSKQMSIRIVNDKTKEVIKEIPPKKIIEMIDKLCELAGIMVDEKA